ADRSHLPRLRRRPLVAAHPRGRIWPPLRAPRLGWAAAASAAPRAPRRARHVRLLSLPLLVQPGAGTCLCFAPPTARSQPPVAAPAPADYTSPKGPGRCSVGVNGCTAEPAERAEDGNR